MGQPRFLPSRRRLGDADAALTSLLEAERIQVATKTRDTIDGASIDIGLASLHKDKGDMQAALAAYERARSTFIATGAAETKNMAFCLMDLANLLRELSLEPDASHLQDQAMRYFQVAKQIMLSSDSYESPGGAGVVKGIANIFRDRGDSTAALENFREARRIRDLTGTLDNSFGAVLVTTIGAVLLEQGGPGATNEARASFEEAKSILEGINHPRDTPEFRVLLEKVDLLSKPG
jgi:tetratricopeptide (TPR) repeat protein